MNTNKEKKNETKQNKTMVIEGGKGVELEILYVKWGGGNFM